MDFVVLSNEHGNLRGRKGTVNAVNQLLVVSSSFLVGEEICLVARRAPRIDRRCKQTTKERRMTHPLPDPRPQGVAHLSRLQTHRTFHPPTTAVNGFSGSVPLTLTSISIVLDGVVVCARSVVAGRAATAKSSATRKAMLRKLARRMKVLLK